MPNCGVRGPRGGDGNRRNGYRERRLVTVVGEVTLRTPKLREGGHFPGDIVRPCSRVDRAMVACVREVYVRGLSTRKIERAADALEFAILSPSRASRMTAELDEEVSAMRAARFDGLRFPYLWLDATYVKCRDEGWMDMSLVDASSPRGVERSAPAPEPPTPELLERARLIVVGAIEERRGAA